MVCNVLARPPGNHAIAALLESLGRDAEAATHRRRAWDAGGVLYRAAAERRHVRMLDVLLPHDLASDVVGQIRERLAQMGSVQAAWLGKKKLAYLTESPLYVLGIVSTARVGWQDLERIAARTRLPGQVLVAGLVAADGDVYAPSVATNVYLLDGRMLFVDAAMQQDVSVSQLQARDA